MSGNLIGKRFTSFPERVWFQNKDGKWQTRPVTMEDVKRRRECISRLERRYS